MLVKNHSINEVFCKVVKAVDVLRNERNFIVGT